MKHTEWDWITVKKLVFFLKFWILHETVKIDNVLGKYTKREQVIS